MKRIIPFIFIVIFSASCNNERKELSVTLFFDKPLTSGTKYPPYFQEIVMPFTSNCKVDFLLKPINICRLDISNKVVETNAWYFKDMGDNTVEFSRGWLEQYFKDSLVNSYLIQASTKIVSIDDWISNNKDSLLIYSEEAQGKEYKGRQIFSTAKELNAKIQELACGNISGKIFVLINPSIFTTTSNEATTIPTEPIVETTANTEQLKKTLLIIANPNLSFADRKAKANEAIKSMFTNDFNVTMREGSATANVTVWERGNGNKYLLERLTTDDSILDFKILRVDKSLTDSKIDHIEIVEIHKVD